MKMVKLLLVGGLLVGAPVTAFAQDDGEAKTKFYNFDDLLIDGQYKKPQVLYTDARQKVKFERLLKLKKDFLPKLKATAKDATLR
ncbi:MAG: hypothetical protein H6704_08870 [Myxococcales bacterium]|nr:hypothetical protein [Myxococcales bacterium]